MKMLNHPQRRFWQEKICAQFPARDHLLVIVADYMADAADKLSVHAHSLVSSAFIQKMVLEELAFSLKLMVMRTAVLEMHLAKHQGLLKGDASCQRFKSFIELLSQPEYQQSFFKKYPVLFEKISIVLQQFLAFKTEFFMHLAQDFPVLQQQFFAHEQGHVLVQMKSSGDAHHQGRGVMVLKFANHRGQEHQLVYKPRSCKMDHAFQQLLGWFNQHLAHKMQTFQILDCGDYGWCEFVTADSCHVMAEVEAFYYRMGVWILLTHVLAGGDLHAENIIAHGAYPVVIDFECFFKPYIHPNAQDANQDFPRHFVTQTMLLPGKSLVSDGFKGFDVSALGGRGGEQGQYEQVVWANPGTDEMHLTKVPMILPMNQNLPRLDGVVVESGDFWQHIVNGFEQAYRILLSHRDDLCQNHASPLWAFKTARVRVLFRGTADYSKLLFESFHPSLLVDDALWQRHFNWLDVQFAKFPALKAVAAAEIADIVTTNIPAFYCRADETKIWDGLDQPVAAPLIASGWECVQHQLQDYCSYEDLHLQKQLIINSFAAHWLNEGRFIVTVTSLPKLSASRPMALLREQLLHHTRMVYDGLLKDHVQNRGRIFWPAVEMKLENVWQAGFTDILLYDGIAGIGLSFARAGMVLNDTRYTDMAKQVWHSLQHTLKTSGKSCVQFVGAYTGLAGLIYVVSQFQLLWQDSESQSWLDTLCHWLPEFIAKDICYDVTHGVMGALAVLVNMRSQLTEAQFKVNADACVDRLLAEYPSPHFFPNTGNVLKVSQPLLGFSHGVAGMAWALAKYHALYPSVAVANWIKQALEYERHLFSQEQQNWPDLRGSEVRYSLAWCHGAPGVGLARMDMQRDWQDPYFDQEIDIALKVTQAYGFKDYNNLCHGNLGNIELLLQAAELRGKLEDQKSYAHYVDAILQQLAQGVYCQRLPLAATPGLMTGAAGVAYQLLRLAFPERLPSVLLLK